MRIFVALLILLLSLSWIQPCSAQAYLRIEVDGWTLRFSVPALDSSVVKPPATRR